MVTILKLGLDHLISPSTKTISFCIESTVKVKRRPLHILKRNEVPRKILVDEFSTGKPVAKELPTPTIGTAPVPERYVPTKEEILKPVAILSCCLKLIFYDL